MRIIINSVIILTVLNLCIFSFSRNFVASRGVNGGLQCAVCTIVTGFLTQLAEVNNQTVLEASLKVCNLLPEKLQAGCNFTVSLVEDILSFDDILEIITPDVFCYGIGVCYVDPGEKYCNLFPLPKNHEFHTVVDKFKKFILKNAKHRKLLSLDVCSLPVMKDLCKLLYEKFEDMRPALDVDGDGFSVVQTGRGSFWRGRDCWDISSNIYPGRESADGDKYIDYDCNGIYGVDDNGISYQDQLCKTPSRGVILVGDSTCARFRLPEAWMDPKLFSKDALSNITDPLLDELDWPQLGFGVGFMNSSYPVLVKGVTDSVYLRLKERNRCNHRDYQNLCRNGDSSFDTARTAKLISRNATTDKPALVIFGVVGNDVCNNAKDTLANITSPQEFRSNILAFLSNLPQQLPPDSHVVLLGLADGSFLYPAMADRIHPLGRLRGEITYKDVYNWFLCMSIGPCNGWLTPDDTLRKNTSKRAMELSDILKDIVKTSKFPFKLHYVDNPFNLIIHQWIKKGKKLWHLIEPVDGFHPNQKAQPMIAKVLWETLLKNSPDALGPINPYNDKIQELFGDQGGH